MPPCFLFEVLCFGEEITVKRSVLDHLLDGTCQINIGEQAHDRRIGRFDCSRFGRSASIRQLGLSSGIAFSDAAF